jgi:hypothetical protein
MNGLVLTCVRRQKLVDVVPMFCLQTPKSLWPGKLVDEDRKKYPAVQRFAYLSQKNNDPHFVRYSEYDSRLSDARCATLAAK